MTIIKRQVQTIRVDYVCPECGKGKMMYTLQSVADREFLHKCDVCKHETYLAAEYPYFQEQVEVWRP